MARRRRQQMFPSVGVVAAALIAAFIAVILVQIYIQAKINKYAKGAIRVVQLKADVKAGDVIRERHLETAEVPAAFTKAFQNALRAGKETLILGDTAPKDLSRGDILFTTDFIDREALEGPLNVSEGYELVTIPIDKGTSPGRQLQPGSYITLRADFDADPDPKEEKPVTKIVLENVAVRTIEGSTKPLPKDKRTIYDDIGIELRASQVEQLTAIRNAMISKDFMITITGAPERPEEREPRINEEVIDEYVRRRTGIGRGF